MPAKRYSNQVFHQYFQARRERERAYCDDVLTRTKAMCFDSRFPTKHRTYYHTYQGMSHVPAINAARVLQSLRDPRFLVFQCVQSRVIRLRFHTGLGHYRTLIGYYDIPLRPRLEMLSVLLDRQRTFQIIVSINMAWRVFKCYNR